MSGRWLASRWIRALFVALVLLMGLSGVASAFDELIPTKVGVVKFGGSPPEGKLFKVVSKAPNPPLFALPTSSPATTGGSLTVTMGSGALSCTLSAGAFDGTVGWLELGNPPGSKGYKYKNQGAPGSDPCRAVTLTEKAIKVVAKATDTLPVPLGSGNPDVFVSLQLGGDRYCGEWTGPYLREKEDSLVKAKDQPPPSACQDNAISCFEDRGLTVFDRCTNLEWEKKDTAPGSSQDPGNLHDVDNMYSWGGRCTIYPHVPCQPNAAAAATCTLQTGGAAACAECGVGQGACDVDPLPRGAITTIWDWLNQVNAESLAGHNDWRLPTTAGPLYMPTGEPAELESIFDGGAAGCGGGGPCIDPIFGPTIANYYHSACTAPFDPITYSLLVDFFESIPPSTLPIGDAIWVRAVRPGS